MWFSRLQYRHARLPDDKGPSQRPGLPSKNAAADYSQSFFGDVVTILVGPRQTKFCVSSIVLKHSSPFFEAALSSNWDRDQSGIIKLPEETPIAFEVFLRHAMASQCVPYLHEIPQYIISTAGWSLDACIEIYVLADKYDVADLRNIAMEAFIPLLKKKSLTIDQGRRIFEDTREDCPMQNLVADWICLADGDFDDLNLIMQHVAGAVAAVEKARSVTLFPRHGITDKRRGLWTQRCYWEHGGYKCGCDRTDKWLVR